MITLQQYLNENLDINEGIKDSIKDVINKVKTKLNKIDYKHIVSKLAVSTALAASLLSPMKIHAEKIPYNSDDLYGINLWVAQNTESKEECYVFSETGKDNEEAARNAFSLLNYAITGKLGNGRQFINKSIVKDYKFNETNDGKIICTLILTPKAKEIAISPVVGAYRLSNGKITDLMEKTIKKEKSDNYYAIIQLTHDETIDKEVNKFTKDVIDDYRQNNNEDCEAIAVVGYDEIEAKNNTALFIHNLSKEGKFKDYKTLNEKGSKELSNGDYVYVLLLAKGSINFNK